MSSSCGEEKLLLSAWFCPFAQRPWIVANMIPEGIVSVVNDCRSMIADTDNGGVHRDLSDGNHYDDIARYMLKGELLGERSVPTLVIPGAQDQTGDSISIAKSLWEDGALAPELCSETVEIIAHEWSDKIAGQFYGALGNKDGRSQELFDVLLDNMVSFGASITGPFFHGDHPSLVDVTMYPFIFRIFTQNLFRTYRSEELSESSLATLEISLSTSSDGCTSSHTHLLRVRRWLDHCLLQPAFTRTLPADADAKSNYLSPRIIELYRIYGMGIGLKGLRSGKLATLNVHND